MRGEYNMRKIRLIQQVVAYLKDILSQLHTHIDRETEIFMASNDYIQE